MPDCIPSDLLNAAIERGLLAPGASLRPLGSGNQDRRLHTRQSWVASRSTGGDLILTLGSELGQLVARQTEFARSCPALVPPPLLFISRPSGDLLVESFCPDPALAALPIENPSIARCAAQAFKSACSALALTQEPSTESARRAEWDSWSAQLVALPCWQETDAQLLAKHILPALYPHIAIAPPATRWSNGDFTADNLLVSAGAVPRLIDFEHARRTHFHAEDAAHFYTLSAIARQHPTLFTLALAQPGPAVQLYFWLRQIKLEVTHNTPSYVAGVWPHRLAVVRRLAEVLLTLDMRGWSVPAQQLLFNVEAARWIGDGSPRLFLAGWCHAPTSPTATAAVLHAGDQLLSETALQVRPDVGQHLSDLCGSQVSGFTLEPVLPGPDVTVTLSLRDGEGTLLPFRTLRSADLPGRGPFFQNYATWAERHDPDPVSATTSSNGPSFSVLVPVYRSDPLFLRGCVDSVVRQHYSRWELILIDDGSGDAALTQLLEQWARAEARIRVLHRAVNGGIARATNDALAAARGDFIVLLDHDDVLRPHALAQFASLLAHDPSIDVTYSDEEKISPAGERLLPFLKPAFSPEFLRGVMYPGHALCVRRSVAHAAGGFDPAFDGVQDYEFFLRVSERNVRIVHLPRILYQWRQSPASSALHGNVKGDMDRRQAEAVQAHLRRIGDNRHARALGGHRVRLEAQHTPTFQVVWHQGSADIMPALRAVAKGSIADILVLHSSGSEPLDQDSLRELATLAVLPDSGCVGPLLISQQSKVIASGLTLDGHQLIPLMAGFDADHDGYNGSLRCSREVLAVPALGAAIRRELLLSSEAEDWATFCLSLSASGLHARVCPAARLVAAAPLEPLNAGNSAPKTDPYYNHHFSRKLGDYSLASPPAHLPAPSRQSIFHFDELPPTFLSDGCAAIRGWCFRRDGRRVKIHVRLGQQNWTTLCDQPRPDVAAAHPNGLTDGHCGFALRLRLPVGSHQLVLESTCENEPPEVLLRHNIVVTPFASIGRMLWTKPEKLLAHQFPAWPVHIPRALKPDSFPTIRSAAGNIPAITVVTPSFQQGGFLEETLRSVLHEPPAQLTYIVQDGGSTDNSLEIIQRHAPRLHAWASAPDRGQADAIARAFAQTSGAPDDVMAWLNSDDFYLPGVLPFIASWFARHPEVDVIYGHRILVDEHSREIGRWFLPKHDDSVLRLNDFVPQETLFWRRRIWDQAGGIDPTLKFAMDWDLLLRFQAAGARIVRIPYFLACFRIHSAQKTSTQINSVGQAEIDFLRARTFGRIVSPDELESHPRLQRYLRRSAITEFLWKLGIRAP